MKRIILVGVGLFLIGAASLAAFNAAQSAPPSLVDAAEQLGLTGLQQDHGWQVCLVGEQVNIPGIGLRQRIELCHSEGWRINTYCLDPNLPAPEINALCSRIEPGSDNFWCGNGVQRLRLFAILDTPAPVEDTLTPTPTDTPVPTLTYTPSSIPTTVQTATALSTETSQPQIEETPVTVVTNTSLPQIEDTPAPLPSATPFSRPRTGGPGNIEAGLAVLGIGLLTGGGFFWLLRRRAGRLAG